MRLVRIRDGTAVARLARTSFYPIKQSGPIPPRRTLGTNAVARLAENITAWTARRPSGPVDGKRRRLEGHN